MTDVDTEAVEHLAAGLWLGEGNRIASMRWEPTAAAWRAIDPTGVTYHQERMTGGMLVSLTRQGTKVPAGWPPAPEASR